MMFAQNPIKINNVIKQSFSLFFKSLPKIWIFLLINISFTKFSNYITNNNKIYNSADFKTIFTPENLPTMFLGCIAFTVSVILSAIIILIMRDIAANKDIRTIEIVKHVTKKIIKLLTAKLFSVGIPLIGTLVFVVPGIFLVVITIFCFLIVLIEDTGSFSALKMCFRMVTPNWFRTAAVLLLPFSFMIFPVLTQYLLTKSPSTYLDILSIILTVITASLFDAFLLVQYNDLRWRFKTRV